MRITDGGVVTILKAPEFVDKNVTVTATSVEDSSVTASKVLRVKGFFSFYIPLKIFIPDKSFRMRYLYRIQGARPLPIADIRRILLRRSARRRLFHRIVHQIASRIADQGRLPKR